MSAASDIVCRLAYAGLVLERGQGQHLRIESPLGSPLSDELRAQVVSHRDELIGWLAWCEIADALLLETSRRVAAQCPRGCPLDDVAWRAAEQVLREAHQSQDLTVFREALERYEYFALKYFAIYRNGAKR